MTSTTNVDKLVEDLLIAPAPKLVQDAGVSYASNTPADTSPTKSGGAASAGGGSGSGSRHKLSTIASVSLEERLKALTLSVQVCEIHIVSQAAEKYAKGTQTDGDPEWNAQPSGGGGAGGAGAAGGDGSGSGGAEGRKSRSGSSSSTADVAAGDADGPAAGAEGDADDSGEQADSKDGGKKNPQELSAEEISSIVSGRTFQEFFDKTVRVTERAVLANAEGKFDVLVEYGEATGGAVDDGSDKVSHAFDFVSERWCAGRSVTKLTWSPSNPELLLASYSAPSGIPSAEVDWASASSTKADPDGLLLVWSLMNQAAPECVGCCCCCCC